MLVPPQKFTTCTTHKHTHTPKKKKKKKEEEEEEKEGGRAPQKRKCAER
jgi:hypothetical protein